jgi:hypothetical protein
MSNGKVILAVLVAVCIVVPGLFLAFPAQSPAVSAIVPFAPIKVPTEDMTVLAYEIELSDFDIDGMALTGAKVYCVDNGTLLQDIGGDYLVATYHPRSVPSPTAEEIWHGTAKLLHPRLSVFLTLANATGLTTLRHQLEFSWRGGQVSVPGPMVSCQDRSIPIIGSPVSGNEWMTMETTIATSHHMRDQITVNNVTHCCQRYAVDYCIMKSDMSLFANGGHNNSDWYEYGADLLAVADGVVTQAVDGIWENTPPNPNSNLTLGEAGGNFVIIDIGGGNYAQYGHMIPGSQTVHIGDRVLKGQVIGKCGNSGNSNGPHLHFQIGSDPFSILASEGLPFLMDSYKVDGKLIADQNTGPIALPLFVPPQEWTSCWFNNYDWMDCGNRTI